MIDLEAIRGRMKGLGFYDFAVADLEALFAEVERLRAEVARTEIVWMMRPHEDPETAFEMMLAREGLDCCRYGCWEVAVAFVDGDPWNPRQPACEEHLEWVVDGVRREWGRAKIIRMEA